MYSKWCQLIFFQLFYNSQGHWTFIFCRLKISESLWSVLHDNCSSSVACGHCAHLNILLWLLFIHLNHWSWLQIYTHETSPYIAHEIPFHKFPCVIQVEPSLYTPKETQNNAVPISRLKEDVAYKFPLSRSNSSYSLFLSYFWSLFIFMTCNVTQKTRKNMHRTVYGILPTRGERTCVILML